jgi:hypothetical protein
MTILIQMCILYWYGRIIDMFHEQVNFLWVRWFGRGLTYHSDWKAKQLPRTWFIDSSDAFGIVGPCEVIRGVHLIPEFAYGKMSDLCHSIARNPKEKDLDWNYGQASPSIY